jgi:hypothetical protein
MRAAAAIAKSRPGTGWKDERDAWQPRYLLTIKKYYTTSSINNQNAFDRNETRDVRLLARCDAEIL